MKIHELCEMFPVMSDAEIKVLADDIKENGQRHPILVWKGQVIDGKNRLAACKLVKVEPKFKEIAKDSDLRHVVASLNINRRHLNESQRAMLAAELMAGNGEAERANLPGDNKAAMKNKEAAKAVNVSERTVKDAKKVKAKGTKALQSAVRQGKVRVSAAAKVASKAPVEQDELVLKGTKAIQKAAASLRKPRGGIFADMQKAKEQSGEIVAETEFTKKEVIKVIKATVEKCFEAWKTADVAVKDLVEAVEAL